MDIIDNLLRAALYECCSPSDANMIEHSIAYENAKHDLILDLEALSQKDPSTSKNLNILSQTNTSFSAVVHYRLAHNIFFGYLKLSNIQKEYYAYLIFQRGKLKSGAEIHFKAKIGERFVLDHGYGTVFGDTTVIGKDCYILGGVTLGATGISRNSTSPRHPIIGNNVQIGCFSKVLGRINIGDNVFIGAGCTITKDISPNCRIVNKIPNYEDIEYLTTQQLVI
jgi:serine O-acetyltransferase